MPCIARRSWRISCSSFEREKLENIGGRQECRPYNIFISMRLLQ